MKILFDGQVTGADGIARSTRHLAAALQRLAPEAGLTLIVAPPTTVPRYSVAEGRRLLALAAEHDADAIHLLDYRVPIGGSSLPVLATVHDLLRLRHPEHCYTDDQFTDRFGSAGLTRLREAVKQLRATASPPPGTTRPPESLHEEFYALMTAYTAGSAAAVLTPTRTVADHLDQAVGRRVNATVAPWGVDHLTSPADQLPEGLRPGQYLLYVGQARSHKGLHQLLDAYRASTAARSGYPLALAGRDFTTALARDLGLEDSIVPLGEVSEPSLARLYADATAAVHLAEHEGFGFTPLEALSLGARVLVSDLPVLHETLGVHARFTDPGDRHATARAIDRLLAEPDTEPERRRRATHASHFRWDTCARVVLAAYRKATT
ncbi:glycosyltransferase [Kitasatospora sp. HPMI-4]|uniref:glycosyltransferase n=1 Tax=Kitasatospora sp. HPMI-4 TaxID=3448443 RepID=UPI003F196CCA